MISHHHFVVDHFTAFTWFLCTWHVAWCLCTSLAVCHVPRYQEGFKPNFQDHLKPVLATVAKVCTALCAVMHDNLLWLSLLQSSPYIHLRPKRLLLWHIGCNRHRV